ncbi:hypothetical protein MMC08_004844 [Hypocenomyce scalaris]|nr:hypothetical protein [Hypocenomyce scalaris]
MKTRQSKQEFGGEKEIDLDVLSYTLAALWPPSSVPTVLESVTIQATTRSVPYRLPLEHDTICNQNERDLNAWQESFLSPKAEKKALVLYGPSTDTEVEDDKGESIERARDFIGSIGPHSYFRGDKGITTKDVVSVSDDHDFALFDGFDNKFKGLFLKDCLDPNGGKLKVRDQQAKWIRPSVLILNQHPDLDESLTDPGKHWIRYHCLLLPTYPLFSKNLRLSSGRRKIELHLSREGAQEGIRPEWEVKMGDDSINHLTDSISRLGTSTPNKGLQSPLRGWKTESPSPSQSPLRAWKTESPSPSQSPLRAWKKESPSSSQSPGRQRY